MKSNVVILNILGIYFVFVAAVYTVWNLIATGTVEWAGSVAILLSAGLVWLISFYLGRIRKSQGGELPEDLPYADIDDGNPEIGEFPPSSWWPIVLAGGAGLIMIGLAVGIWLALLALPLVPIAVTGWVYEFYRGRYAR